MLTNERRRQILNSVKSSGFPGGVSEAFRAAEQGIDVVAQFQEQQAQEQEMQVAQTEQEQETGLREEHAAGNTQASMAFPNVKPNQSFNTVGMKAPIDIQKVDGQGHLVESYKNVPPGIANLPTGSAEGTIIESPAAYQKGGVRKYQTAGFNFNPADFNPNYEGGSVSDNTTNSHFQEDHSNFKEKEEQLAKIAADKKYAETQAQIKAQKGTLVNTTHKNAANMLSNSMLTNQLAGGYGGSNMRKSIEANPEKTEEIYKNTMRSSGQNTMRDVALGVASFGAGAQIANSGTSNFAQRALSYPSGAVSKSLEKVITSPTVRGMVAPTLKGAYNAGYITGLPNVIGSTIGTGIDYASGKSSGLDSGLKVAKNLANFAPAVKGFNKIAPLANNYSQIKTIGKAGYDVYKGNYTNAAARLTTLHPSLSTGGKYALKFLKKALPKTSYVQQELPLSLLGKSATATPKKLKYGGYKSKYFI